MENKPSSRNYYPSLVKRIYLEGIKKFNDEEAGLMPIKFNPWNKIKIEKKQVHTSVPSHWRSVESFCRYS